MLQPGNDKKSEPVITLQLRNFVNMKLMIAINTNAVSKCLWHFIVKKAPRRTFTLHVVFVGLHLMACHDLCFWFDVKNLILVTDLN